ncbi:MAG: hypothetical protein Unbinned838contig1000_16 [Prokaryotic dsDNA virus sp.]|nr:MAG: hypothetical protein Unbinned838contig1000_16 [Prokaryotic dsDNA virus sp.]|tara:strand:+ start:21593 stop:22273 length:681 start_codon:yes stop_codon:yes gene_type:complete
MSKTATPTVITEYDITYRLNKLKCCFATKAAELVDKQRFGKECKDELCNLKLLGAYIEIIECYSPLPCNCKGEWELDGSIVWTQSYGTIPYGKVVKAYMKPNANPGEYLYLRWQGVAPLVQPAGTCFDNTGFAFPCMTGLNGIGPATWSVCGHVKEAWQAAGSVDWDASVVYGMGDIVRFMGGGVGANQTKRGKYFISITEPNPMNTGFHESGHWVELKCYPKQEV